MQPVQHPGRQKAGHGEASTLDQHTPQAASGQALQHRRRMEPLTCRGLVQMKNLQHPVSDRRASAGTLQPQGRGGAVLKHLPIRWNPAGWVQDHTYRVVTAHMTHRQSRVVRNHGPGSHDHCVHEGPEAMQMLDVLRSGHEMRVATVGGDAPVQRLPELCDHQFPGFDERQIDGLDLGAATRRGVDRWLSGTWLAFLAPPECGEASEDRVPLPCFRALVVHGPERP